VGCPQLVGRVEELRELAELVAGAAAGAGGSAFVLGEAGIGKSRLLAAATDVTRSREMTVLRGRAAASSAPAPYRAVAEALLSAFRGRELAHDPALARYRSALGVLVPGSTDGSGTDDPSVVLLGEATLALIERCAAPAGTVVLLEDLQWAGAETCELIDYLVDKLDGRAIALLASVRTGTPSEAARLAQTVAARRHARLVSLGRLGPRQVDAMIRAALDTAAVPTGLTEIVTAASGGVPFLVEELLASLIQGGSLWRDGRVWKAQPSLRAGVPASFETLVAERLAGLTASERTVLEAAAVLGERFDWRLLPAVTGLPEDDVVAGLARAVETQLVEEVAAAGPGGYRFRHGLSRAAVLEAASKPQRERMARRGLDVLAVDAGGHAPDGADLELVADLALAAGDAGLAARCLTAAAGAAAQLGAYLSARHSAELAATLATCPEEAVEANEIILDACAACGDAGRAAEVGELLLAQLATLGAAADRIAHVHLRLAVAAVDATDWVRAEAHLDEVAGRLPEPPAKVRVRADLLRAGVALGRHEPYAAAEHAERARRAAEETGDPLLLAEASALLGRAHRVTDVDAARRDFTMALAAAERTGSAIAIARATHELATLDVLFAGSVAAMERARVLAADAGALALTAVADLQLGILHWLHVNLEPCCAALQRAQDAAVRHDLGLLELAAAALLGSVDAVQGRRHEALARFEEYRARMDDEIEATARGHGLAVAALAWEDRSGALAELDQAKKLAPRHSTVARAPHCGLRVLVLAVDADPAAPAAVEELRTDGAVVGPPRALTELAQAVTSGRAGDRELAGRQAEAALAALRPTPWFRAIAQRLAGEAAVVDGWGAPADWLAEAHGFFEAQGLPAPLEACRRLLRAAGAPTPRPTAAVGPAAPGLHPGLVRLGITRREAEVLELIARGLSNREVAEQLYLSVRTVEKHVERLLAKTATGSRVQLAALAHRSSEPGGRAT
jgi:DNA-binding CsgD family transcriptional regulator